jgi:hypothetical protein
VKMELTKVRNDAKQRVMISIFRCRAKITISQRVRNTDSNCVDVGYDGVSLYAPARCYGTPDELRHLIDTAHQLGIAVLIDAVYNHLGPDGNYLSCYRLNIDV